MTGIMQMFVGGSFGTGPGSQLFSTPGTYTWVVPSGVTRVSVVMVGASNEDTNNFLSSGGGGLTYNNNMTVTPGASYTIKVGNSNMCFCGDTSACSLGAVIFRASGRFGGTGNRSSGGNGICSGSVFNAAGGGGAGGYSGNGGNGGSGSSNGVAGAGGGGGGGSGSTSYGGGGAKVPCITCGGWAFVCAFIVYTGGGGGGGVGVFGSGSNGAGGVVVAGSNAGAGGGGSGGGSGGNTTTQDAGGGGAYGGGKGSVGYYVFCPVSASCGGAVVCYAGFATGSRAGAGRGAVRIVWPGDTRQFPSTCVGNP